MKNLKGVFVGSGSDGMSNLGVTQAILELSEKKTPNVLYIGTATYDLPQFKKRQTQDLEKVGCSIKSLCLVDQEISEFEIKSSVHDADVVVVGGGNTLFAIDRWNRLGLSQYLIQQAESGNLVLTGGSAGAICWFSGGHSDSMDPESYRLAMLKQFAPNDKPPRSPVEESTTVKDGQVKDWKYIRVPGLGLLPGVLCPHHDLVQSNGILRAEDFDDMLLDNFARYGSTDAPEIGIGIDHWAALVLEGNGRYRVLALDGKPGSCMVDGGKVSFSKDREGIPGIWIKQATATGEIVSTPCPSSGLLADLLNGVTYDFPQDSEVAKLWDQCREENPDTGPCVSNH